MKRRITVIIEGREYHVEVADLSERPVRATVNEKTYHVYVRNQDGPVVTEVRPAESEQAGRTSPPVTLPATARPAKQPLPDGAIRAPMPGDIFEVRVKPGDRVQSGDVVCVLEAMKMKNLIHSAQAGVVERVEVDAGQTVDYGDVLVTLAQR